MLTDGTAVSIAAGVTTNVFAGRPIEFLGAPSNITILADADAAGQTCQILVNNGGQQFAPVAAGVPLNVATAPGVGPKNDEDVLVTFGVQAGSRLQFNITNTSGAAVISRWRAIITP